jgi:hypothetical protein
VQSASPNVGADLGVLTLNPGPQVACSSIDKTFFGDQLSLRIT